MPTTRAKAVHILVGTSDRGLAALIADKLTPSGITCEPFADVAAVEARVSRGEHDACLLDAAWHELARVLAAHAESGPIVLLETAEQEIDTPALDAGIEDIVFVHPAMSGRSLARLMTAAIRRFRLRQRLDEDLRQQRGLVQALLHHVPLFVGAIDAAGVLQWANPELARLLGHPVVELKGRPLFDVLVPEAAERDRVAAGVERTPGTWIHSTIRAADRRRLEVAWLSTPLPSGGLLIVGRDVTTLHALERHVAQTSKLDAMGRLAGGIAHDFNNVITMIAGSAELLAEQFREGTAEQVEALEILRACESARALTGQLLAFGRADRQRPSVIDLNAAIRNVQPMIERLIGPDADIAFALSPGRLPVCIDEGQVDQVLVNLAINARDAIAGGGSIAIATSTVEIDADEARRRSGLRAGPHARLTCSDTGVGMTEETRRRIFEPFFTTKPKGHGTGIGMATVHTIVTGAHGAIEVASAPGQGTTFTILWPIERRRSAPRAEPPAIEPATRHTTVLLVEDHAGIRAVCQRVLEREGHRVLAATSGTEALQVLRGHDDIGLVITDIRLGTGENGLAVLDVVRRQRPKTPLLLMSGQAPGPVPDDVGFLEKPFTPAGLVAAVRSVIGG